MSSTSTSPARSSRVGIVDFGGGNLYSVARAVQAAGGKPVRTQSPDELRDFDRIILPGVGETGSCMSQLHKADIVGELQSAAANKPFLAVCVGMQMLGQYSEEGDGVECLKVVKGRVVRLPGGRDGAGRRLKVPHIGWTPVTQQPHPCWQGIADRQRFYFVHSYYMQAEGRADCVGTAQHGTHLAAAIGTDNLFATQFHPEKSGADGLRLYANFLNWNP